MRRAASVDQQYASSPPPQLPCRPGAEDARSHDDHVPTVRTVARARCFASGGQTGLRTVGGSIVRVGTKPVGGNTSVCPEPGDPALSQALGMPAAGGRRFAQCVYRNAASFCTSSTSNRTNAVAVTFVP